MGLKNHETFCLIRPGLDMFGSGPNDRVAKKKSCYMMWSWKELAVALRHGNNKRIPKDGPG